VLIEVAHIATFVEGENVLEIIVVGLLIQNEPTGYPCESAKKDSMNFVKLAKSDSAVEL
jgi:hypothetical protein